MFMTMQKQLKNILLFILSVIVVLSCFPTVSEAKPLSRRIVKIGYYENDTFQYGASEKAVKGGYAYDYIQRLQVYTNWTFEYVYGEYGNLYNSLVDGQIDLLAGIAFTEEREELISYPELPMGESTYVYLKRADAKDITEDFKTFEGKKIGTLSGAMKAIVDRMLEEYDIKADVVLFSDISDRNNALKNKNVDIIIAEGVSTPAMEGIEVVAQAGANDMFICVSKKRPDILSELNAGQSKLMEANPKIYSQLSEKWFKNNITDSTLSAKEIEWINQHKVLNVGCYNHCSPYSMTDNSGKITGAITDIVEEMLRGLSIEDVEINYIGYESFEDMHKALNDGAIDLSFPAYSEYWSAENLGIMPTGPILSSYFEWIYFGENPDMSDATIAIQRSNLFLSAYKSVAFPKNEVLYCESVYDCMDAVLSGKADATIISAQSMDFLLKSKEKYTKLNSIMLADAVPTGFGVNRNSSDTLDIIDHAIYLLDSDFAMSATYKYTLRNKIRLIDLIRQNYPAAAAIVIVLAVIIIGLTMRELHKNKRFIMQEELQKAILEEKVHDITELNEKLQDNQVKLEESVCEQEAQLQEITALNTELEDNQEKLQSQMDIIKSMGKVYFSSYYIDFFDDSYIELTSTENIREAIGNQSHAQAALFLMADKLVQPGFEDKMREFLTLSTLSERMKDTNVVTCEYKGVTTGWSQAYLIAGDRDDAGRIRHVFLANRMIHREKEREEAQNRSLEEARDAAEAANNAKTAFLFNMSHDIRTPMNAIIGFRDLLEKNQDNPEKRRDYLRKIDEASAVLLSIINNVLEMARIEKGTLEIEEIVWNTEQFNDTLYSVFEEMMIQKNIEFTRDIKVEHHYVYCDPTKLREVYINILSNAYKYTNPGGKVHMLLEEVPCEIAGWVLYRTTISDNGIGMSEEFIPHIFEEFTREKNTTDAKIEGTGLGMSIVKRLVDFMNGTIEVESKQGVGSTFTVTIPHRIASKDGLEEHMGLEIDPKLFKDKRILLAEDNELNAEIATEILSDAGFIVETAEDGKICVEKMDQHPAGYYNLVLMDIQMPNMNGYEATKAIRTMEDYAKATIPIIAMTANAFEEDKREAYRVGMNAHLAKPINVKLLLRELTRILT